MSITDQQAVAFGFLAMIAEDMYDAAIGSLNPLADPRIAAFGWTIVGHGQSSTHYWAESATIPALVIAVLTLVVPAPSQRW